MIRSVAFRIAVLVFPALLLLVFSDYRVSASDRVKGADFRFFENRPPANEFPMLDAEGNPLRLASLRGNVVLLNFWRGNCKYCGMEKGLLRKMKKQSGSGSVKVLCVNLWDRPSWIRHYAKRRWSDFLFATRSGNGRATQQVHVNGTLTGYYVMNGNREAVYEVKGFPTTYVIDTEGRVVASHVGMARWNRKSVTAWLSKLASQGSRMLVHPSELHELPAWLNTLLASDPIRAGRNEAYPRRRIGKGPVR